MDQPSNLHRRQLPANWFDYRRSLEPRTSLPPMVVIRIPQNKTGIRIKVPMNIVQEDLIPARIQSKSLNLSRPTHREFAKSHRKAMRTFPRARVWAAYLLNPLLAMMRRL